MSSKGAIARVYSRGAMARVTSKGAIAQCLEYYRKCCNEIHRVIVPQVHAKFVVGLGENGLQLSVGGGDGRSSCSCK